MVTLSKPRPYRITQANNLAAPSMANTAWQSNTQQLHEQILRESLNSKVPRKSAQYLLKIDDQREFVDAWLVVRLFASF